MRAGNWMWLAAFSMAAPACKQQGSGSMMSTRQGGNDQVQEQQQSATAQQQAASSQQATAGNEQQVSGKVAQASSEELRIDGQQPLRIDPSTQVTLDGQPASAAQLQPGSDVRASFRTEGNEAKAIRIEARSAH